MKNWLKSGLKKQKKVVEVKQCSKHRSTYQKKRSPNSAQSGGVSEFSFFGSVLPDGFRPDSDIDILVAFEEDSKNTLFDLVHIVDELKQIFGREVDLLTRRGVEQSRNYCLPQVNPLVTGAAYVA